MTCIILCDNKDLKSMKFSALIILANRCFMRSQKRGLTGAKGVLLAMSVLTEVINNIHTCGHRM